MIQPNCSSNQFRKCLPVIKLLLVLSHGQAALEREFSVSKEVVVDNLSQRSTEARRVICDHVRFIGGLLKAPLTKDVIQSVSSSRGKYEYHRQQMRQYTQRSTSENETTSRKK